MSQYLNKDGISYLTYRYSYVFAPKSHTHNYAASNKAGGAAMSTYGTLTLTVNTTSYVFDGSKDKSPVITKASIGLGNVDNTSDSNKSVEYASSAGSATNADKVDGYDVATAGTTKPWSMLVSIGSDGVSEMGRYIDFHYDNTTGSDYSLRMQVPGNNSNTITLPTATGTLALTSQLSDTKNTAGSNNSTSKLYLIGATSQAANPVTNSNSLCYTQNSYLYSYGNKVIAENDALTTTEVESICKEILGV